MLVVDVNSSFCNDGVNRKQKSKDDVVVPKISLGVFLFFFDSNDPQNLASRIYLYDAAAPMVSGVTVYLPNPLSV